MKKTKVCMVCKKSFIPDPRVGDRQKVCKNLHCQRQRKKLAQKQWLLKNPDYFKRRYPQLKEQILNYQKSHSQQADKKAITIQDELIGYNNKLLRILNKARTIQDELTLKILLTKQPFLQPSAYYTRQVNFQ